MIKVWTDDAEAGLLDRYGERGSSCPGGVYVLLSLGTTNRFGAPLSGRYPRAT